MLKKIEIKKKSSNKLKEQEQQVKEISKQQSDKTPKKGLKRFSRTGFRIVMIIVAIVFVLGVVVAVWRWQTQMQKVTQYTDNGEVIVEPCLNILNPECWSEAFKPELLKENNKTGILIVGSDARHNNSFIGNTDTIMLAVYDYTTHRFKTISFARDIYAPYQYRENGPTYYARINSIYAAGSLYGENKDGTAVFKRTIERITGIKIQYVVVVRFDGVINGVDSLGGIDVNVTKDITDAYPKPDLPDDLRASCNKPRLKNNDHSLDDFCIFSFKQGVQHMTGIQALIYARMRELSTDFDRARRQQEVVNAIKDKILNDQTSLTDKAENLLSLYNGIKDYIDPKFDLNLETVLAGLSLANDVKNNGDSVKIVVDPNFGGGGVVVHGEGTGYKFTDTSFKQLQSKLQTIDRYVEYYIDSPNIYVVNASGVGLNNSHPLIALKNARLWFLRMNIVTGKNPDNKTGIEIVDYTGGQMHETITRLQSDLAGLGNITVVTATTENGLKPVKGENIGVYLYPINAPTATVAPTQNN